MARKSIFLNKVSYIQLHMHWRIPDSAIQIWYERNYAIIWPCRIYILYNLHYNFMEQKNRNGKWSFSAHVLVLCFLSIAYVYEKLYTGWSLSFRNNLQQWEKIIWWGESESILIWILQSFHQTVHVASREYYWNDYGKGSNMTLSFIIRFNDFYYPYTRTKREAVL